MEFRYIQPDQLRAWWPSLRPGLDKIKTRSPENWIVEDVYTDLFNGKSMVWVCIDNDRYAGFFVLQPMGLTMHVWAGYTLENNQQIVENSLKYIKILASQANAKFITFSSHRNGWQRRAAQLGFRPKQWICEV
jgi:hypothetical protein